MHMNAHAAVGAGIALTTYSLVPEALLAAAPLAVVSHCLMDLIDEPRGWRRAEHLFFDAAFMSVFVAMAVAAGPELGLVMLFGWFFGNLPDIIDKKGYLSTLFPQRFPAMRWWFCHQGGYAKVKPAGFATIAASFLLFSALWVLTSVPDATM